MKQIIYITDFIEGQPVIASVRYSGLMKYISKAFQVIVINDENYSKDKTSFAEINFKFRTTRSRFTQSINDKKSRRSVVEGLLRNRLTLSLWRHYSLSKYNFLKRNKDLINTINRYIETNKVHAIFVTVPDVQGIYLAEVIKKNCPQIPLIVEIRDILNNNIGKGNPQFIYKKAEDIIIKNADGIIALSEGIYDYYSKKAIDTKIEIIKNGYNLEDFSDCIFKPTSLEEDIIIFSHIGSIYKGRNLNDFINSLMIICEQLKKKIIFNVVGYLDDEAMRDLEEIRSIVDKSNLDINVTGTISHSDALNYLKESHVAVILTHKKGSDYAIPGKTFEYIGACKPIIAVTEDKGLIGLINGRYGECAKHQTMDITDKILKLLNCNYNFDDRFVFSRENQASKIVKFINDTIEQGERSI